MQRALIELSAQLSADQARQSETEQQIGLEQSYKMAHIMVIIFRMEIQIKRHLPLTCIDFMFLSKYSLT